MTLHSFNRAALAAALFAGVAASSTASAQDNQGRLKLFGHRYSVIAGAAMFVPREGATRTLYGERTFMPVLSLWNFDTKSGLGFSWDVGGDRLTEGDRRAEMLHAGLGPRILFANSSADFAPYVTARADGYLMRLDRGEWHTKPGVNVEVGASILRHVVLSGRYDRIGKLGGVDLSGFSARAAIKVF